VIAALLHGEEALRGAWKAASIDWRRQLVAAVSTGTRLAAQCAAATAST
jgi:hypothetical protein